VNYTTARCGCQVVAVGAPGSLVRRSIESRHCGKPRCESGLPGKFTDRECAAYVWLHHVSYAWSVDYLDKSATDHIHNERYPSLIELAQSKGWEG
jgi:hypothetical protein